MTNIEQKALALAREVSPDDKNRVCKEPTVYFGLWEALCRAIEQHEAFRKEVSDAVVDAIAIIDNGEEEVAIQELTRFIIAKPDPIEEAAEEALSRPDKPFLEALRAALAKRGGRIVFDDM